MTVVTWSVPSGVLVSAGRADPEFYDPRAELVSGALWDQGADALARWVTSASRGVGPEYSLEGTVRVVKTANVQRFSLAPRPAQYVSEAFTRTNRRAVIPKAALMITATGVGSAGRTFVKLDDEPMVADAHVTVLPTGDIEKAAFLCAYLQSPIGRQQLLQRRRGSSRQLEIYPRDILSVLVPRVTKAKRDIIASRWLAATQLVAASASAVADTDTRILALVGGDGAAVDDWGDRIWEDSRSGLEVGRRIDAEFRVPPVQRLRRRILDAGGIPMSELLVSMRKGFQPMHYVDDGDIYVIKSKDVHYPELDLFSCDRTTDDGWPYQLDGGEVLLNMTGQGTLGRSTVVPSEEAQELSLIPSVDIYALNVNRAFVLPEYLALFLNSLIGRRLTESLQTGSSGQQHLYPAHFSAIPVPIPRTAAGEPDLEWQQSIVSTAEARNAATHAARKTGAELDADFLERLGVPVDLSILPF
ncbi:MAG: hypothetical protein JWN10_689 [Solirubrobacterales bacterium]|nr:hypothetical protein [Solirubrobacterales bacterium]